MEEAATETRIRRRGQALEESTKYPAPATQRYTCKQHSTHLNGAPGTQAGQFFGSGVDRGGGSQQLVLGNHGGVIGVFHIGTWNTIKIFIMHAQQQLWVIKISKRIQNLQAKADFLIFNTIFFYS